MAPEPRGNWPVNFNDYDNDLVEQEYDGKWAADAMSNNDLEKLTADIQRQASDAQALFANVGQPKPPP